MIRKKISVTVLSACILVVFIMMALYVLPKGKSDKYSIRFAVDSYFHSVSIADYSGVLNELGGVAKINALRDVSALSRPSIINLVYQTISSSGPIATDEVTVQSDTQEQDEILTLFNVRNVWKIIDIQYSPWHLRNVIESAKAPTNAVATVKNFIFDSSNGYLQVALSLLTGTAYNQTAQFVQYKHSQPAVLVKNYRVKQTTRWSSSECGVEVVYRTVFSKYVINHDEWLSLVKVNNSWRIDNVLSV